MKFKAPAPTPPGLWRRVPPAVFPSIMGLFGLGLAWRRGADVFVLPRGIAEAILGAVALLFVFALLAYSVKLIRRPSVIVEELRILPGRAGVAAMVLSIYLLSMTLAPYAPAVAQAILVAGFSVHAALVVLLVHQFVTGPAEQRRVTPIWHLSYVGFIIGALAATVFEFYILSLVLLIATALIAALIWSVSLEQVIKETVPAPLRPLLAIHLSPVALIGLVAAALELEAVAMGCAGVLGALGGVHLSARRDGKPLADRRRYLALAGRDHAGRGDADRPRDRLQGGPALGGRSAFRQDQRGNRLDQRHPGPGERKAGRVGLWPMGGGVHRVIAVPARPDRLRRLGESLRPLGDDGAVRLEMELGAIGRAAEAEGLMGDGTGFGQMHGAVRQGEGVAVPLEDRELRAGRAQDRIAGPRRRRAHPVPAELRRGAEDVGAAISAREDLRAKADAEDRLVGRAVAPHQAGEGGQVGVARVVEGVLLAAEDDERVMRLPVLRQRPVEEGPEDRDLGPGLVQRLAQRAEPRQSGILDDSDTHDFLRLVLLIDHAAGPGARHGPRRRI